MISPAENFNAFSGHRMNQKGDSATFEIGKRRVISPEKNALFTFYHLLNRTVTNVPWVFWLQLFLSFVQLAIAVISPFCHKMWEVIPDMKPVNEILIIIVRYIPTNAPDVVETAAFIVYAILTIACFVFILVTIHMVKLQKEVTPLIKIYFFYNTVFMPLFRPSMACVLSHQMLKIIKVHTFGAFVVSLIALVCVLLHLVNVGFFAFATATSPNPNTHNPMAIWCPNAYNNVEFECFVVFNFVLLEVTKDCSPMTFGIILAVYTVIVLVPQFIYHQSVTYFISFFAYEFMYTILLATILFEIVVIVFAFVQFYLSYILVLVIWLVLPGILFTILHIVVQMRVKKALKLLDDNIPQTLIGSKTDIEDDFENVENTYEKLNVADAKHALRISRVACIYSHPSFMDLSLVHYFLDRYPEILFEMLHMAFLIPDQGTFVTNLIDKFLDMHEPSFLQEAILFQIITSQTESSSELSPSLIRELSFQNLQAMKCQQIISKVWSSCYKGDITAMSRNAFTLNKIITNLNKKWTYLALRYPFSLPVLKEYIKFLKTTGCQHARSEAITKANPKLVENQTVCLDNNININILKQAVEESTDRRPIYSIKKLELCLTLSIIFTILVMIATVVVGYILFQDTSSSVSLLSNTGTCLEHLVQTPNKFAKIAEIESTSMEKEERAARDEIYTFTRYLSNSYNVMLDTMPDDTVTNIQKHTEDLYFKLKDYESTNQSTLINTLSQFIYYESSLSYVPSDDELIELINKNLLNASKLVIKTADDIIDNGKELSKTINYSSYVFYAIGAALILLVIIPVFVVFINGLKDEMNYLFSLYLTMPRSTIGKFIDINNTKKVEHKSISMMLTSSVAQVARQTNTSDQSSDDSQEEKVGNVADAFKVLANDNVTNQSVLPPGFKCKALAIVFIATALPMIIGFINILLLSLEIKEINKCMETINLISDRTYEASLILHGIISKTIATDELKTNIDKAMSYHTTLLFSSSSQISKKMFNTKKFQSYHFDQNCDDASKLECSSLATLFDDFILSVTNFINDGIPEPTDPTVVKLRDNYNDYLFPLMEELHGEMANYTLDQIKYYQDIIIILCVVGVVILLLLFSLFALPVIRELNEAVMSVKLPLKFIDPLDLSEQGKLMQYLQGECDYGSQKFNDTQTGAPSGATFLNAIMSPFAVFESDLSLLFANNAMYQLLKTSREATVGLPLVEIFSRVMPFEEDENHPFNSLLETIQQLQRGVAAHNFAEIVTEMKVRDKASFPIIIRLVGITDDSKSSHEEAEQNKDSQNIKATQYIVHVTNLAAKHELEDKLKFESDISAKLLENAIAKPILQALSQNDKLTPRKLTNKPLLIFTVNSEHAEEELNDNILDGCSLFMRTAKAINPSFGSVSPLLCKAPMWIYIGGVNQSEDDIKIGMDELTLFALSIIEVFAQSISKASVTLTALVHTGDITIIPLQFELPQVELIGKGFEDLVNLSPKCQKGKLTATQEGSEVLGTFKDVMLHPYQDKVDNMILYNVERVNEVTDEFSIA